MLGERGERELWQADNQYLGFVGPNTFYGRLAGLRGELFRDEEFADLYCLDNGRPGVSPALLATALLLQAHDRCSDHEAKQRADYDLRWKVALGVEVDERPFAKSTLQLFRAQMLANDGLGNIFRKSLELARRRGLLGRKRSRLAVDTTPIFGRGAVRDTYNLIGDGIVKLLRVLAYVSAREPDDYAAEHGFSDYLGSSLKGRAAIDWSDKRQRRKFLARIVADADRLLAIAGDALSPLPADDPRAGEIGRAAAILARILLQDVKRSGPEPEIVRDGRGDRVCSVHDPEIRHGRKSSEQGFAGHKASVAVETEHGLFTAVAVLPGNAPDADGLMDLVKESERNAAAEAEAVIGDCAYGDGDTRQDFDDAGRTLIARLPARPDSRYFPKEDFRIDLDAMTCTCPAGQTTSRLRRSGFRRGAAGGAHQNRYFLFDRASCAACPLKAGCTRASARTVRLHPQEALLQRARELQQGPQWPEIARLRAVVEHRLARLIQLGVRQARYVGRRKVLGQLLLAAAVANITLALNAGEVRPTDGSEPAEGANRGRNAGKIGQMAAIGRILTQKRLVAAIRAVPALISRMCATTTFGSPPLAKSGGFRPGF